MSKPILSVQDVCEQIGRGRTWLWYSVKRGEFPQPIRLGLKTIAWLPIQIEQWKAEQAQNETKAEA